MLFSTVKPSFLSSQQDQKEGKATLLSVSNDDYLPTPLEKPKRGQLKEKKSKTFRFSRQDSPAFLASDENRVRNEWNPSTSRLDLEYTHDLEPEYPLISPSQQESLQRKFDKKKQLCRLLLKGLLGWVVTSFLIAMIWVSLNHFSEKHVMSDGKKREFNSVITALSLALGFNMAASFKAMALDMRWWILSRKRRSLREVDLILGCDSMMNVLKLMYIAPRPMVIIACLSWLAVNLGAQAAVAMLGLTYSVDSGTTYALTAFGNVTSPDMKFFYPDNKKSHPSQETQAYIANIYGNVALSYEFEPSYKIDLIARPGMTWTPDAADYFEGEDFYEYVFLDSNPGNGSSSISMYTNRTIRASGACSSASAILQNASVESYVNSTIYTPTAANLTCGPRCAVIDALEVGASVTDAWLYSCNITIGYPANTTIGSSQYVSDGMASIAAKAIALQPYGSQQRYPMEATYGHPKKGDAAAMAKLISRFSIGSIISAGYNNPISYRLGNQPQQGVVLTIDKPTYMLLILFLTAGTQGLLFVLSALLANRVVVRDDTHLATARLLRPLMERLGRSGNVADGKDISEALGADVPESHGKHLEVIYSVKHAQEGYLHNLDLGEQKALRRGFPEGLYE